jgi:pilus assembly protein CpaF
MNENIFDKLDFGPLKSLLDDDDITDISYDNNGQIWIRSLTQGSIRVEVNGATPEFVEKLAFQCSNVMGTTFNNAKPFLDAESSELRLNFVHPSIATNGIAMVIRKTPAKIRLEKEKLLKDDYFTQDIHDILIKCVEGHCNIIVSGETGSGKTEFVKYLASHTKTNEKIITIEDTLELHLDKIFPQRDIVSMKTNNVASYTDVLVTCMRQNPKWILLSEVRSAEAVTAVRNSISSGHNILSTIHADKASAIPYRLYSLMETDLDVNQFLSTIYRYIQLGVHIRAYYSKEKGKFHREVDEVTEFYVDENNQPQSRTIYQKVFGKEPMLRKPSKHLIEYLENQNIDITAVTSHMVDDLPFDNDEDDATTASAENTSAETKPVETEVPTENTGATPDQNPVVNNEAPAGNVMPISEPAPATAPVMPVPEPVSATETVLPTATPVNQEVVQTPTQEQPENQATPAPVAETEQPSTSQVIPTASVVLPTPEATTNVPLQPEVVLPNLETVMAQPIPEQPAVTQETQQPSVPEPVIPLTPTTEAPANVPLQPETVVIPTANAQVIPSVAPVIPEPLPTLGSNPGVQQ